MPKQFYKEPVILGFSVLAVLVVGCGLWLWSTAPKEKTTLTVDRVRPTAGAYRHTMEYQFSKQEDTSDAISSNNSNQPEESNE